MSNFTQAVSSRQLGSHAGCHGDVYKHAITGFPTCERCGMTLRHPQEILNPPVVHPRVSERVLLGELRF